jgi:thioredoxin reductase (NADPH)
MLKTSIAIIGAGPAGCSAAVQCCRLGIKPLLLDATGQVGGLVKNARLIENYPGFIDGITGLDFKIELQKYLKKFKIDVINKEIIKISQKDDGFILNSKTNPTEEIFAKKIILATGTRPNHFSLPLIKNSVNPVVYYEVHDLLPFTPKQVIIIGGGEASFDYALSLSSKNCEVTIIIRSSTSKTKGLLLKEVESCSNIKIKYNTTTLKWGKSSSGVDLLINEDGRAKLIHGEFILVAIGRNSTLSDFSLETRGNIFTNLDGLFIAGDARLGGLGQIGTAIGDGLWAAFNATEGLE